jgi:hypothetical protein
MDADSATLVVPGGWAAAFGQCDDRAIVDVGPRSVLAVVADATSPTYGGHYLPLGMDLGLASLRGELRAHDHVCELACLVGAVDAAHRAMRELDRAVASECERVADVAEPLLRRARAGGRIAARYGLGEGDRLVHTGASLTACLFVGERVHVAQIGSGRAYRWRGGHTTVLMRDHKLTSEIVAAGSKPMPEHSAVVTRILGFADDSRVDYASFEVASGDRFLVCTDGAWEAVDIDRVLARSSAEAMIAVAREAFTGAPRDDLAIAALVM